MSTKLSARRMLTSAFAWLVVAAGMALALLGLLLDSIAIQSSPGFNLPQLLMIAGGAGLALLGWMLRGDNFRRRIARELRANAVKIIVITLTTALALEVALTLAGMETAFSLNQPPVDARWLRLRECGAAGCSYHYERAQALCAEGVLVERYCALNHAGYRDDDEFVAPDADIEKRILVLGDSFTHGFAADIGLSFPARLDTLLPDALVWNTGITGHGTNSQLAVFRAYAPVLQPQFTVLAFFAGNDFADNLYPLDGWIHAQRKDGVERATRRYAMDYLGNPVRLDIDTALRYHLKRQRAPTSHAQLVIGSTRLGSLFLRGLDTAGYILARGQPELNRETTREYLRMLRDEADSHDSALLTLLVPGEDDMFALTEKYIAARQMLAELGMPYLEVRDRLTLEVDYGEFDKHWSNAGHGKIADMLSACIEAYFAQGSLQACEGVVAP